MSIIDTVQAFDSNTSAVILLPLLLVGGLVVLWMQPPAKDAPVKSTVGPITTLANVLSSRGPEFILNLRETLNASVFQHNLPVPGGAYVIANARDQREILLDATSNKAASLHKVFDQITGYPSMATRDNKDSRRKEVRKWMASAFSSAEVDRMNNICIKQVKKWENEVLEKIVDTDGTFDPSAHLPKIIFKSIVEAGFEYHSTDEEIDNFTTCLAYAFREFTFAQTMNPLRKVFGFFIPGVRKAHRCSRVVQDFAKVVLKAYRENPNKSKSKTFIRMIEECPHNLTEAEKVGELASLLVAGADTTGHTIANAIVQLARHPEELKALQALMKQGKSQEATERLKRAVTESNRLTPVAAQGAARIVNRDFIFLDQPSNRKVRIRKGATVFLPYVLSHRDAAIFEDVNAFKPSRWENPTKEMTESMLTFGLGSRSCPALSLATAEIFSTLPSIFSKYEIEVADPGSMDFFFTWKFVGAKLRVKHLKA